MTQAGVTCQAARLDTHRDVQAQRRTDQIPLTCCALLDGHLRVAHWGCRRVPQEDPSPRCVGTAAAQTTAGPASHSGSIPPSCGAGSISCSCQPRRFWEKRGSPSSTSVHKSDCRVGAVAPRLARPWHGAGVCPQPPKRNSLVAGTGEGAALAGLTVPSTAAPQPLASTSFCLLRPARVPLRGPRRCCETPPQRKPALHPPVPG